MTSGGVPRRDFLRGAATFGVATLVASKGGLPKPVIDVRDHGAKGNGKHNDTKAIQSAINEAARQHGTVKFPKGRYTSGTLKLRNGSTLLLAAGAVLQMSKDSTDFLPRKPEPHTFSDFETSDFQNALLTGRNLKNITIAGKGTIDGRTDHRYGPKPIALFKCKRINIIGITIRNAANYCVSLGGCEDITVHRVTIRDAFADGIDPDCCKRVVITDCDIESDDDAVVLKTSLILGTPAVTQDVHVSGCRLNSPSNGFKIGTETSGNVRDVVVRDCQIIGTPRRGADPANVVLSEEGGGVAIESVDGAIVENVHVSDITVKDCDVPIFVRLGTRGRGQPIPTPGALRNVTIGQLDATGATEAITISGVPGHSIGQLTLEDVEVSIDPGTEPPTAPVPELEAEYPQAGMFGALPASGVYVRHASLLTLRNVSVRLGKPDPRPLLVSEDVSGLTVDPPIA